MRAADIYGLGAAIGFSPRQVDEMTPWELLACMDGYNHANGVKPKDEPPTDEEFAAAVAASEARRRKKGG